MQPQDKETIPSATPRSFPGRLRTTLWLSCAFVLAGCAGTQYGSRNYLVVLTTVPPNCEAWLVPNTRWVSEREQLLAPDGKVLATCESGLTPWEIRKPPYLYVFVARDAAHHLRWKPFKPSQDATVTIDFSAETAVEGAAPPPPADGRGRT
jgi:hypothetical protein